MTRPSVPRKRQSLSDQLVLFIAIVLGFANVAFYFHEDGMKAVNWIALVVSVVILLVLYRLLHRSAPKHN